MRHHQYFSARTAEFYPFQRELSDKLLIYQKKKNARHKDRRRLSQKKKKGKSKTQAVTKQQRCRQSKQEPERETIRANRGAAKSEEGEAAGLNTQGRQSARAIGATEEEERNK